MELLLITATRLKIVMSNEDMERYEITCDSLDYGDDETKRVIRSILDEAKQKVGFDAKGRHVLVQVFPSKDGGCEMYVTKTYSESKSGLPVPIRNTGKETPSVFRFGSSSRLLDACRHLMGRGDILSSSAFSDPESERFYLLLYTPERDAFGREPILLSVANEYGDLVKTEYGLAYLKEHCRCICEKDAVQRLGVLS